MSLPKEPNDKQEFYLRKAAQLAHRSNLLHRHGCIIVHSQTGEILSSGFNHTCIKMHCKYSCHAEYDALRKIKKTFDLTNAEMYVVRLGPDGLKLSKPCEGCTKLIMKAQIGKVYYSWSELIK